MSKIIFVLIYFWKYDKIIIQYWYLNSYDSSERFKKSGCCTLYQTSLKYIFVATAVLLWNAKQGTKCVGCFAGSWSLTYAGKRTDAAIRQRHNNINRLHQLWLYRLLFPSHWSVSTQQRGLSADPAPFPTRTIITSLLQPLIACIPLDFCVNASSRWAWLCFFTFWKALFTGSNHQQTLCQITTNIMY